MFNEWIKVTEMLQSEIAQVTVTFFGLQRTQNSSMRKHCERHVGIFSNSQKRLSLLHAQVNDKCPDSSRSPLKRNCSTKWIENYNAVFVFKKFYPAVVGSLDQLSESRDGEVLERPMPYSKAITTAGVLISLEVINATETYQNCCKEATGHQEIMLNALDTTRITSCKDVIQAFMDNEKIFVVLFRHAESVYEESTPMPRIVNQQANTANPLAQGWATCCPRAICSPPG